MADHMTSRGHHKDFARLNATLRYCMFTAYTVTPGALGPDRQAAIDEATAFFSTLGQSGVTLRGIYDLSGIRAEADIMVWWHHDGEVEPLQAAYKAFRRTTLGQACTPYWSEVSLNRPAEFNKSHIPAVTADEEPGKYICVYPFVRSYDWYLLDEKERRSILAEHGRAARDYPDVRANTMPAFALGDYEWILAFEAPTLDRIVDLMRVMRSTEARRHVREEVPFFTGPRVEVPELGALIESLP